jgi:hypothetical protein
MPASRANAGHATSEVLTPLPCNSPRPWFAPVQREKGPGDLGHSALAPPHNLKFGCEP